MSKIELNISDKKLYNTTKEDIIFRPPSKIPHKSLQDLLILKSINSSEISYYDIASTEQQKIKNIDPVVITFFNKYFEISNNEIQSLKGDLNIKMGDYDGI